MHNDDLSILKTALYINAILILFPLTIDMNNNRKENAPSVVISKRHALEQHKLRKFTYSKVKGLWHAFDPIIS